MPSAKFRTSPRNIALLIATQRFYDSAPRVTVRFPNDPPYPVATKRASPSMRENCSHACRHSVPDPPKTRTFGCQGESPAKSRLLWIYSLLFIRLSINFPGGESVDQCRTLVLRYRLATRVFSRNVVPFSWIQNIAFLLYPYLYAEYPAWMPFIENISICNEKSREHIP